MNCSGVTNSIVGATPPGELFQTAWFVDATNGNDANPGTAALPIKTLAELQMRFEGKRLTGNTTVTLIGTFNEALTLSCIVPSGMLLTVTGDTPITQYSGAIGAFTALSTGVPSTLQDAGLVAANHVKQRFRVTSGGASGAIAWGLKDVAADTMRMSRFCQPFTGASATPAAGNTYVVETLTTSVIGLSIWVTGDGQRPLTGMRGVEIHDLIFKGAGQVVHTVGGDYLAVACSGCFFTESIQHLVSSASAITLRACAHDGANLALEGRAYLQAHAALGYVTILNNAYIVANSAACFQGAAIVVGFMAKLHFNDVTAMFDIPNTPGQTSAIWLESHSEVLQEENGVFGSGITANYGIRAESEASFVYETIKPALTGALGDTIIGNIPKPYGSIPYINPANNAAIVQSTKGGATPSDPGLLTQTAWYVDATNGDDSNPGTLAEPIKTLKELQLRFEAKRLTANTSVTLIGNFTEILTLNCVIPEGMTLTVSGAATTQYSGTIGTFTALAAPATPASIQDAGMTAANEVQRRFRMTSGGANGALTFGLKATAADTERVGQFTSPTTGAAANPANGNTYVTETLDSSIGGYALTPSGDGEIHIQHLRIVPVSPFVNKIVGAPRLYVIGCIFNGFFDYLGTGQNTRFWACQFLNALSLQVTLCTLNGCVFFDDVTCVNLSLAFFQGAASCWQGGTLDAQRGGQIDASIDLAFFDTGAAGNDAAVMLAESSYFNSLTGGKVWTVNPAQAYGIRVISGCMYTYVTQPTATGVTNDTIVGGTAKAYAAIPYVEPANNAAIVLRA